MRKTKGVQETRHLWEEMSQGPSSSISKPALSQ